MINYQQGGTTNNHWRRLRSSLACLESLERTLTIDLRLLTSINVVAADAKAEYVHLVNSVAMLAEEGKKAQENLSNFRESLDLSQCDDITDRLTELLVHHPIGNNFLHHSLGTGGFLKLIDHTTQALATRCANYSRSYKLLVDPVVLGSRSKVPFGVLALRVGDVFSQTPSDDGDCGVAEAGALCLAGPWALLACVVIATAVLIAVDEGEAGGDGDQIGDFPVPDPGGDQRA